jgi:uncharacterized damage-inducible protein DinB
VRADEVRTLLRFTSWANRQVLSTAAEAGPEVFTAPTSVTYRNLRDTLVHSLDVERSWRDRLRGRSKEEWDSALDPSAFASAEELADRWAREDAELERWLAGLDDDAMDATVDLGGRDVFPRWYFLVHIVSHSAEQRRDAAILLRLAGHPPPDLEFLWYADTLGASLG